MGSLRPATILVAAMILAACGEPGEIVVGYAVPAWGAPVLQLIEAELEEAGNPRGIRIAYEPVETHESLAAIVGAAERLATEATIAVVGHGGSRASLAGAAVYDHAGIVQIVPIATSRLLAEAGPWVFPLASNDSLQGVFIAGHAYHELGARSALVLYVNDEYGDGLRASIVAAFRELGGLILDEIVTHESADAAVILEAALAHSSPDVVLLAVPTATAATVLHALRSLEPNLPVIAGDGALHQPHVYDHDHHALDRFHAVAFWIEGDGTAVSRDFAARFLEVTGRDAQPFHAMAYDALSLVIAAVQDGARRPADVRDYLVGLGATRSAFPGVTGPIEFGPDRPPRLRMVRIVDGRAVP